MTTTERNSSNLAVKTTEEDEEGKQEVTANLAGAKEISMDAPVLVAFSELQEILTLREEQRTALKAVVVVVSMCKTTTSSADMISHRTTLTGSVGCKIPDWPA